MTTTTHVSHKFELLTALPSLADSTVTREHSTFSFISFPLGHSSLAVDDDDDDGLVAASAPSVRLRISR